MKALEIITGISRPWYVSAIIAVCVCIACYILMSIGTYYVLKKLNYHHPGFAWVPLGQMIALGFAASEEDGTNRIFGLKAPNMLLALYPLVGIAVSYIPEIGTILSLAVYIIGAGTIFSYIYAKIEDTSIEDQYVIGYVSGAIPLIAMIKFLMYRSEANTENKQQEEAQPNIEPTQESGT